MFEGVPDQFHQFIASRTTLPLPLSFPPLHHHHHHHHHGPPSSIAPFSSTSFDPYSNTAPSHHQQQVPQLQPNFLQQHHPLQQCSPTTKTEDKQETTNMDVAMNLEIERDQRSITGSVDPWSNDEVLALLRVRSSLENWFPEFTWEHVSRKLAELGYRRSAETCKEKFEEESRCFSNINYNKNYRAFTELEEIYDGDHQNPQEVSAAEKNKGLDKPTEEQDKVGQEMIEEDSKVDQTEANPTDNIDEDKGKSDPPKPKSKKRKRGNKFEMFKGFCEDIVHKMMAQQEEMHTKLLEDMVKRDEEKLEREEAWKKQEMDRFNKELELRAHEQALAGDRQAKIIKFLTTFSSNSASVNELLGETNIQELLKVPTTSNQSTSSPALLENPNPNIQPNNRSKNEASTSSALALGHQNPGSLPASNIQVSTPSSSIRNQAHQSPSSTRAPGIAKTPTSDKLALASQNPNSSSIQNKPPAPSISFTAAHKIQTKSTSSDKDDLGKRWPRDEVLALINLRCSIQNNEDKEGSSTPKAPLWERISQGMTGLGYKRSAKRCKEKWENINKYFRKTKDVNKKRSMDSRTCPYFHQLSTLYNQGKLVAPAHEEPETSLINSPENHLALPETKHSSSQNGTNNSTTHVAEGEKNMAQVAAFEFEF